MKLRIPDDVIFRELAGEAVILNLATGTYFGLDPIGTRIWHLISEHGSPEKILEVLLTEYEVDAAQLRRDLGELIAKLTGEGLITTHDDPAPPPASSLPESGRA